MTHKLLVCVMAVLTSLNYGSSYWNGNPFQGVSTVAFIFCFLLTIAVIVEK